MKVLIGVDDSEHANRTLEFVRTMPWPTDTTMIVVSAVQVPYVAYPAAEGFIPVAADTGDWLRTLTTMHEELASRAARTLADAGFHTESRVLHGDPRVALIEEAKKEHVDLVVVGSHGRSGIEKLLMGSVASHVVSHASCSVLVVKR